ncbi:MAG: hypothetical protein R3B11_14765 [Nitrospira sp.]|nr:hypothetical protein [Nitrospira sp.]
MIEPTSTSTPTLPDWATGPFHDFLGHQQDLARILHMSASGISMLRGRYQAIKVLKEIDGEAEETDDLKWAEREKELAQQEVDNDFPLLHEQATVFLWGSLEALVRSFAASWLANRPETWRNEAIKRLRVRLGDYQSLDPTERCLWVVDLLDQESGGPLHAGVARFESLLQPLGLTGAFPEEGRKALFELSQIRNAIVHRRGRADRRLIDACPWLIISSGEQIKISHAMWKSYDAVVSEYVMELIQRVRESFGLKRYKAKNVTTTRNG